jgi:hypothetical protein
VNSEAVKALNLLELKPIRNTRSETNEEGLVTLLVPKFQNQWTVRWLIPLLAKPYIRLKLDKYGSYIWNACDGNTTVRDIGLKMSEKFGEEIDSLYERIGLFIRRLDESQSLLITGISNDGMIFEKSKK